MNVKKQDMEMGHFSVSAASVPPSTPSPMRSEFWLTTQAIAIQAIANGMVWSYIVSGLRTSFPQSLKGFPPALCPLPATSCCNFLKSSHDLNLWFIKDRHLVKAGWDRRDSCSLIEASKPKGKRKSTQETLTLGKVWEKGEGSHLMDRSRAFD